MDKIAIAGGVASNGTLRAAMEEACSKHGYKFYRLPIFCTDNAAMIGVAAYYEYKKGTRHGWDLNAVPNLRLGREIKPQLWRTYYETGEKYSNCSGSRSGEKG